MSQYLKEVKDLYRRKAAFAPFAKWGLCVYEWEVSLFEVKLCSDVSHGHLARPCPQGQAVSLQAAASCTRCALSSEFHWTLKNLPKLCCWSRVTAWKLGCSVHMPLYKAGSNCIFACWFSAWMYSSSAVEFIMYITKFVCKIVRPPTREHWGKKLTLC